jgi:hypothetical protein
MTYIFQDKLDQLKPGDKILTHANLGRKNRTVEYVNKDGETPCIKLEDDEKELFVFHWNFFFEANTIIKIKSSG